MYPFERFSESAKRVLTLAQEEAERSHHSYIGTEHLLLGLIRAGEGLGFRALANLGVELEAARNTIAQVLGRNERIIIQQIIPTSRVKKVIEIAFEVARKEGSAKVGTEHLLVALLTEGEGIAAHVLVDMGAGLDSVRRELSRLAEMPQPEVSPPETQPMTPTTSWKGQPKVTLSHIIDSALRESRAQGADEVLPEHLLLALFEHPAGPAYQVLAEANLSAPAVRQRLAELDAPPPASG